MDKQATHRPAMSHLFLPCPACLTVLVGLLLLGLGLKRAVSLHDALLLGQSEVLECELQQGVFAIMENGRATSFPHYSFTSRHSDSTPWAACHPSSSFSARGVAGVVVMGVQVGLVGRLELCPHTTAHRQPCHLHLALRQ